MPDAPDPPPLFEPEPHPEEPPEAPMGVSDAHGVVAIAAGLGVLAMSCICCYDTVEDEFLIIGTMAAGAAATWSGLYGVLTYGSIYGRTLSAAGLAALITSSAVLCFGTALGFIR